VIKILFSMLKMAEYIKSVLYSSWEHNGVREVGKRVLVKMSGIKCRYIDEDFVCCHDAGLE
jgi:hypothetical protein